MNGLEKDKKTNTENYVYFKYRCGTNIDSHSEGLGTTYELFLISL